ncbi:unnamed protein product, partial [marine sediment metagenome]
AENWEDQAKRTKEMFSEAGISIRFWEGNLVEIYRYRRTEKF